MYVFEKWGLLFDEGRGRSFSGGLTGLVQMAFLYSLGTDRTENTASNSSSIVG
jgi:hypothetical protein